MGYKLKVGPPSGLKLKGAAGFGLPLIGRIGLLFQKIGGIWYGDLDYSQFAEITSFDATQKLFAVYDRTTGVWNRVSFASLIVAGQTMQYVTAGDVVVQPTDGLIIIDKTVGAATSVTMPASTAKVGRCKIVDFKGDASTNPITTGLAGSDKFNGNQSTWTISGNGGSIVLDPVPGKGYAV
ncbi:MAG: hypothetical protein IJ935_07445 [Afipia sp.]|nr:hypothetical protein [Afipia sp.]